MIKPTVATVSTLKINNNEAIETSDLLAVEEPMEIRIGYGELSNRMQKSIAVTMRTPGHDFELALGFLLSEGIINNYDSVHSIKYCNELQTLSDQQNIVRVELHTWVKIDVSKLQRNFYSTSSCGICGKESIEQVMLQCAPIKHSKNIKLSYSMLTRLPHTLRNQQTVFTYTGGIHACGLFTESGELILLREDVGRHNALDKLIGAAYGASVNALPNGILVLSGRASFELLQKAAMCSIPIVCAVGAPSSLAVETAKMFDITLIGFLREQRFNVYNASAQVQISK